MISIKPSRKGLLHKKLGIPLSKPIPNKALEAARNSKSATLRKEATFAMNAKKFNKAPSIKADPKAVSGLAAPKASAPSLAKPVVKGFGKHGQIKTVAKSGNRHGGPAESLTPTASHFDKL